MIKLREGVNLNPEWFETKIKLPGNMRFLELCFILALMNLLLCGFCLFVFNKQQSPHTIKWPEFTLFPFQSLSVETVPFRYDFTVSVPRVTEAIIQCFFRGVKRFITKLKQEQCLKFNECAFHGTSTFKF